VGSNPTLSATNLSIFKTLQIIGVDARSTDSTIFSSACRRERVGPYVDAYEATPL
jgi:hypothetical protein